jgi:predicted transport protein
MNELIGRVVCIHLLDENQENVLFEVPFLLLEARYVKRDKDFRKSFNKLKMKLKNLETESLNTKTVYFTKNGNLSDFSDENGVLNLKVYFKDLENPDRNKHIYDYINIANFLHGSGNFSLYKEKMLNYLVLFSDQK